MKKRMFSLVAGVAVLAALVIATLMITPEEEVPEPIDMMSATPAASFFFDTPHVPVRLVFTDAANHFVLKMTEELDVWTLAERGEADMFMIDNSAVRHTAFNIEQLAYWQSLTDFAGDLADFGLHPPQATLTFTCADGISHTLALGYETPAQDGRFVLLNGDSDTVYVINVHVAQALMLDFDMLAYGWLPRVEPLDIHDVFIHEAAAGKVPFAAALSEDAHIQALAAEFGITNLEMISPFPGRTVSVHTLVEQVLGGVLNARFDRAISVAPADLAPYGLYEPRLVVRIAEGGTMFTFAVGGDAGDDMSYVLFDGVLYVMSDALLAPLFNINLFAIMDTFIALEFITEISHITIENNMTDNRGTARHTLVVNNSVGDDDIATIAPTVNSRDVPEQDFRDFYQRLIGLRLDGVTANFDPAVRPPRLTIIYSYIDESADKTITFYDYNDHFFAVNDGVAHDVWFAIGRQQVMLMLSALEAL